VGVGLSSNPEQALSELFHRHVESYLMGEAASRNDEEVWHAFREPLDRMKVTPRLRPKRIVAPNFEYEFAGAWKNKIWHVYEAVSFDLVDASSILAKANRWFGQGANLQESTEPFQMHFLIGEPREHAMEPTFIKAQNILSKIPGEKELILESKRDEFAEELAREISLHPE
jgi:hypothetical protein